MEVEKVCGTTPGLSPTAVDVGSVKNPSEKKKTRSQVRGGEEGGRRKEVICLLK